MSILRMIFRPAYTKLPTQRVGLSITPMYMHLRVCMQNNMDVKTCKFCKMPKISPFLAPKFRNFRLPNLKVSIYTQNLLLYQNPCRKIDLDNIKNRKSGGRGVKSDFFDFDPQKIQKRIRIEKFDPLFRKIDVKTHLINEKNRG